MPSIRIFAYGRTERAETVSTILKCISDILLSVALTLNEHSEVDISATFTSTQVPIRSFLMLGVGNNTEFSASLFISRIM